MKTLRILLCMMAITLFAPIVNAECPADNDIYAYGMGAGMFKVVTNHPDFKIKVKRCELVGNTLYIDMIWQNIGDEDVTIFLGNSGAVKAYDDEGNSYSGGFSYGSGIVVSWGKESGFWGKSFPLPANVSAKVGLQIKKVPDSASEITSLTIPLGCSEWGMNFSVGNDFVKLTGLPISKEGDE